MTKLQIAVLVPLILGLLVSLLAPFKAYGDAIKPGLGDLLNGGIGLGLLGIGGILALILRKKG